jgi:hypothetical protein
MELDLDRGLIKKAGSQHPDTEFFLLIRGLDGASLGLLEVENPSTCSYMEGGEFSHRITVYLNSED